MVRERKKGSGRTRLRCGARGSRLSSVQAAEALDLLASRAEGFAADLLLFDTPGDRDLVTPIAQSAPDFFTRDLDDALRDGHIDLAIHSAKDLPQDIADDLDWFWLPDPADPRDALVLRKGVRTPSRIGVSSARREAYARARFPRAKLLPIRGAIDSRLRQVADGRFDAVLMAMAGLTRLYPDGAFDGLPVDVAPIPEDELAPPEGQGVLAVVFRKGDARLDAVRRAFVKAVRFVGAGVGDAGLITVRGAQDLAEADVVLADALSGWRAPDLGQTARWIDVGKRCGAHTMPQDAITRLICDEVRKGRRVVRLKGGDAGLFGRLAEEMEALDALGLPYLLRPGVSALTAATTPNGLLLTKRGVAGGFAVSTPRSDGTKTPQVFFMATRMARETLKRFPPDEPYAMVWDACGPHERIETGVCGRPRLHADASPGLLVVGFAGVPRIRRRVLLTCSEAVMPQAVCAFEDRGWTVVPWPMIRLATRAACACRLKASVRRAEAVVLTSPGAVEAFFGAWGGDVRTLPEIWTCGAGTDAALRRHGVASDILPARDFSAKGLVARLREEGDRLKGRRVLRIRSAQAGRTLATALRRMGASVEDVVLYDTVPVPHEGGLPATDAVFFASASAVGAFRAAYGADALSARAIYVIGEPTRCALPASLRAKASIFPILSGQGCSCRASEQQPQTP